MSRDEEEACNGLRIEGYVMIGDCKTAANTGKADG
jgi:hypothetical protein